MMCFFYRRKVQKRVTEHLFQLKLKLHILQIILGGIQYKKRFKMVGFVKYATKHTHTGYFFHTQLVF